MAIRTITVSELTRGDIFDSGGLAYRVKTEPAVVDGATQVEVKYQDGSLHTRAWADPDTPIEIRRDTQADGATRVDGVDV